MPHRILIVEDQRDVTRMLRSALESLNRGYLLTDVPSAEEAQLEFRRNKFDLLLTDLRLPGKSGLDVIRQARTLNPKIPVIVISAYHNDKIAAELRTVGATFFPKPVKLEQLLPTVQQMLGDKQPAAKSADPEGKQPGLAERLSTLRRDLGALAVFMVDQDGKIVVRAGDVMRLDLDAMITYLMEAFSAALKVCQVLGGIVPANVQFFDGDDFDVYSVNVGQYFALISVFDGQRGQNQMGAVIRYGRQCADDLMNSLVHMGIDLEPTSQPMDSFMAETVAVATPPTKPAPAQAGAPAPAQPVPARPATAPLLMPKTAPLVMRAEPPKEPPKPMTAEELKALDEALSKTQTSTQSADSFWDAALSESEVSNVRSDALSWEQAEKLGLIPPK